jgi:hypothetical protein
MPKVTVNAYLAVDIEVFIKKDPLLWCCLHFLSLFHTFSVTRPKVPKLWGVPPGGGAVGPLVGGARRLYERHIYFERNMDES